MNKNIVLGGGVSGLTAANVLMEQTDFALVLEKAPTLGGFTRSYSVDGYTFDYTGHLLHLSRYKWPQDIPYARQSMWDWQVITRHSAVWWNEQLFTAPVQYNVGALPYSMRETIIDELREIAQRGPATPSNFYDYLLGTFGPTLTSIFLAPQNSKTLGISLARLTPGAMGRFLPKPTHDVLAAEGAPVQSYNSTFFYPARGGIGSMIDRMDDHDFVRYVGWEAREIDMAAKRITPADGGLGIATYDKLYTSVPLPMLCRMTGDAELIALSEQLSAASTLCINVGAVGTLKGTQWEKLHWVYFPEEALPFYRMGFYSNLAQTMAPEGCTSLYIEACYEPTMSITEQVNECIRSAFNDIGLGLHVDTVSAHVMRNSYVHMTSARERVLPLILNKLRDNNIYPIGRYGLWDYMSIEDCIADTIKIVKGSLE